MPIASPPKRTKLPPTDRAGEMATACLTLTRFRREFDKAGLPLEWRHWVADSLKEGLEALPEQSIEQE